MKRTKPFYSHSKKENDVKVGSKKLIDHINGVENLVSNAKGILHPSISKEVQQKLLRHLAQFHDIGKYTSYFQNYLLGQRIVDHHLKNHSKIGAFAIHQFYNKVDERISSIAYYLVKSHHTNLVSFNDDPLFSTDRIQLEYQFKKQAEDIGNNINAISTELNIPQLNNLFKFPDKIIRKHLKAIVRESKICNYFLINYLFSILIEADKLDASDSPIYRSKYIEDSIVENYINNFKADKLKNSVRHSVTSQIEVDNFAYEGRLFTLTAPTGIGKTLTALEFALKIRAKHFEKTGELKKVIYALPFINIIEQAVEIYSEVIGNKGKIIAHYQYATPEENESNYNKYLMLLETWQADIIITTFVQLFETIISNKNSSLKKFHHLQDSILILDEVQAIDLNQLPLVGAVLFHLSKFMNTTILLMTATKPLIFELSDELLVDEKCSYTELLPNYPEVFRKFNRTKIISYQLHIEVNSKTLLELIKKYSANRNSILLVCNKIDTSLRYFYLIKNSFAEQDFKVLYLSTNLIHSDRLKVINSVKYLIGQNEKVILVSTQSIEAGVDLSFEIGFRDLAPLDSIIQVAGRVNRVNDKSNRNAPVIVFNTGDCKTIYGSLTEDVVLSLLLDKPEIQEENYLELIEEYFKKISSRKSFDVSIEIFNALRNLEYTDGLSDISISDYQLIITNDFKISVFIENDSIGKNSLKNFNEYVRGIINKGEFEKSKSDFYKRIVQVPKTFESNFSKSQKLTENLFFVETDVLEQFYNSETGFIRIEEQKSNSNYFF